MLDLSNLDNLYQKLEPLDANSRNKEIKSKWVHSDLHVDHKSFVGRLLHKWFVTHWIFDKSCSISLKNAISNLELMASDKKSLPPEKIVSILKACDVLTLFAKRFKKKKQSPLLDQINKIREMLVPLPAQSPLLNTPFSEAEKKPEDTQSVRELFQNAATTKDPLYFQQTLDSYLKDHPEKVEEVVQNAEQVLQQGHIHTAEIAAARVLKADPTCQSAEKLKTSIVSSKLDEIITQLRDPKRAKEGKEAIKELINKEEDLPSLLTLITKMDKIYYRSLIVSEIIADEKYSPQLIQYIEEHLKDDHYFFGQILSEILTKHPDQVTEVQALAQNFLNQGQLRAAQFVNDKILKSNPSSLNALMFDDDLCSATRRNNGVILSEKYPSNIEVLQKSTLHYHNYLYPSWENEVDKLIALEPDNPTHTVLKAKLLSYSPKALEYINESLIKFPNHPELVFLLVEVQMHLGFEDFTQTDVDNLISQLNSIKKEDPYFTMACICKSNLYSYFKKSVLSLAALNDGIKASPDDKDLILQRACYYFRKKDPDSIKLAKEDYQKVLEILSTQNFSIIDQLSHKEIDTIAIADPKNMKIMEAHALGQYRNGRLVKVLATIDRGLKLNPQNTQLLFLQGIVWYSSSSPHHTIPPLNIVPPDKRPYLEKAINSFRAVLQIDPENEKAEAMLYHSLLLSDPQNEDLKKIEAKWTEKLKADPFHKPLGDWKSHHMDLRHALEKRMNLCRFKKQTLLCQDIFECAHVMAAMRAEGYV